MSESKAIQNKSNINKKGELDNIEHMVGKIDKDEDIDPESSVGELVMETMEAQREFHSGPLPSPRTLKEYGELDENFPKVIVDSFERQNNHRIDMERKMLDSDIRNERLGMVLAFILAMTGLLGGLILSYFGKIGAGITAFLGSLVSLVGTFVYGKYKQSKELKLKDIKMLLNVPDKDEG